MLNRFAFILAGSLLMLPNTHAAFGGFQFGIGAGAIYMGGKHVYRNPADISGASTQFKKVKELSYLFGGYAAYLFEMISTKMTIGIQVYTHAAGPSEVVQLQIQAPGTSPEGTVKIENSGAFGGSLIVGSMVNPKVMFYGCLGYERDQYKFTYNFFNNAVALGLPRAVSYNKRLAGIALGIGATYKFSQSFLISGELMVPFFKRFVPVKTGNRLYNYYPRQYRFMVKLGYLFSI